MKRVLAAVLGAGLLLAGCGQSSPPATTSSGTSADGVNHLWTASPSEGQSLYAALSQGLKSQDFNVGLSITATNGWGPIELNTSNGEYLAGDGHPITLNGKVYATGLGVHADSEIHVHATNLETPACTRFQADVGVDDEVGDKGSVVFQVFADGVKLFDSGVMTGASTTQHIDVGIGNKSDLRFVVTNGGDGYSFDHADWAGATLICGPATPADTKPPTIFFPGSDPFTPYVNQAVKLPVNISDDTGLQSVRVFARGVLVGSSDPSEYGQSGVTKIVIDGASIYPTIPLGVQKQVGDLPIVVLATDTSGNKTQGNFNINISPAPVVSSYSPNTGPLKGGTVVVVKGQYFASGPFSVRVGGSDSLSPVVNSDGTSFSFTTPAGKGSVPIVLDGYFGTITVGTFSYADPSLTLAEDNLDVYHLHTGTLHATFNNFPSGDIQLQLVANPLPPYSNTAPFPPPLALETSSVTLDGTSKLTEDIVVSAPTKLNLYTMLPSDTFELIASKGGIELARTAVNLKELPIKFTATINPDTIVGKGGDVRTVVVTVTADPPLSAPATLRLTEVPNEFALHLLSVGPTTGTGATMQATATFSLDSGFTPSEPLTQNIGVGVGDITTGYRDYFYGSSPNAIIKYTINP